MALPGSPPSSEGGAPDSPTSRGRRGGRHQGTSVASVAEVVPYDYTLGVQLLRRQWRQRRGYSIRDLARRAGVAFMTIHRIEVGRISPTVAMLGKLSKALGIHVRDFFPPPRRHKPKQRRRRPKR